jgi:outer membrane protein
MLSQITTKTKLLQGLLFCAACFGALGQAQADDAHVAFFDAQRVMRESAPAKAAESKLEKDFSKRSKELQDLGASIKAAAEKLDKDAPVISDSERLKRQRELADNDADFKRKQRVFQEDLNQRKNEEIAALSDRVYKAVKQIAESEKYDIVLQDVVYFSPRVDITEKVLKALSAPAK